MANKISVLIDVVTSGANKSLGDFRKSIQEADGAAGKMKVGVTGAFDLIKSNAGNLAMAGGAALFAFGTKAVGEFQRVALEAGRLSEALGIPVDDMSRLMEVAGDVGVPVDALEKSIGRMNITAGKTPGYFDEIGASIVRNKDGTINVKDTFLNVVDALNAMPDAAKRAEAAQRIFGRGWQGMAELIVGGSDEIRTAMDDVSEMQAISPEEVQKARDYRDAMDKLEDAMAGVVIAVGGALAPALTTIATGVGAVTTAVEELEKKTGINLFHGLLSADFWKFGDTWDKGPGAILKDLTGFEGEPVAQELDKVEGGVDELAEAVIDHGNIMSDVEISAGRVAAATEAATDRMELAWDDLNRELSDRSAYLDIEDALANVESAYVTAMDTADKSLSEQEADARNVERAVIDLKGKVNEYAEEVAGLPPEYATKIEALIDEGKFLEVERRLATLEKIRIARITPETFMPSTRISGARASGGPVSAGGTYLVGEEGPELLQMGSSGGNVIPNGATVGTGGGTGGTTNITINATTADPKAIVAALREHVKFNGPIQGIT